MYRLIMYNKTYSSWSVRPWLAMTAADIPFTDEVFGLREEDQRKSVRGISPSGLLPVLIDGDVKMWDSLAIIEYLAERHPNAGLWPADRVARAHARSICAEMHSGFAPLRRECPMNLRRTRKRHEISDDAVANVRRIEEIWADTRARFGASGPYLFGAFTAADAYYAPVVNRFDVYDVTVGPDTAAYMQAVKAHPAWKKLLAECAGEPRIAAFEKLG